MKFKELNEYYKNIYNKDIPRSTLTRWIQEGKLKAEKQENGLYDYDFESFKEIIKSGDYLKKIRASKENPKDYIGKEIHDLKILGIVPKEEYQKNYKGTLMSCQCLRCGKIVQVRFSYLTPNGNYEQYSCGCSRKERAFLASSRPGLTEELLKPFREDFEKFLVVHKLLRLNTDKYYSSCDISEYIDALKKIYNDNQFNAVYNFWLNQNKLNTFYDWAKPSLDHIIPKSKGGGHNIENLQVLTVFENLSKRDLTMDEWNSFKKETNSQSDYYIENILKKWGGKDNG